MGYNVYLNMFFLILKGVIVFFEWDEVKRYEWYWDWYNSKLIYLSNINFSLGFLF